jgi:hypothetical protein
MSQGLILIDALSSLVGRRKKRKKKEKKSGQGLFSQSKRLDTPCCLCQALSRLLGAIKA